jgi:hypothetical protein
MEKERKGGLKIRKEETFCLNEEEKTKERKIFKIKEKS